MKLSMQMTDEAVLQELGGRLAAARLARNLTQAALAQAAGVAKRTVERLESGEVAIQLAGFLRVCRALGLMDRFDAFIPEQATSPIAQLKLQGRQRQRASVKKTKLKESKKWTWGKQ